MDKKTELIEQVDEIIAMPQITLDIMGLLNDHATTISDISNKVKLDEALVAFVLKNCNSPLYGIKNRVNSIPQALSLLGFSTIKIILMSYINKNLFNISGKSEIKNKLWVHSVAVASFSQAIALQINVEPEEAYLSGLLHDIGKLIMYGSENSTFERILKKIEINGENSYTVEENELGYNHMEIGSMLMKKWKFSKSLIDVAQFHQSELYYNKKNKFIGIVAFANLLTYQEIDEIIVDLSFFIKKHKLSENKLGKIILTGLNLKDKYLEF